MSTLARMSIRSYLALLGILVAILALFAFGWWIPNAETWQRCGASTPFSLTRGLFEKPDLLACLALQKDLPPLPG